MILAAIGLIESLLTLNLVGEITNAGAPASSIAQGVANTITGFFGGMGGCKCDDQSTINVKSGGVLRFSCCPVLVGVHPVFTSGLIERIHWQRWSVLCSWS
jgi:SulP family sulfate permease